MVNFGGLPMPDVRRTLELMSKGSVSKVSVRENNSHTEHPSIKDLYCSVAVVEPLAEMDPLIGL